MGEECWTAALTWELGHMLGADKIERLTNHIPGLRQLPAKLRTRLQAASNWKELPAGAVVLTGENAGQSCLLVLEGQIRVTLLSTEGREIVLFRTRPSDRCVISTGDLRGHASCPVRIQGETACVAVVVPEATLMELVSASEEFRDFVCSSFASRTADLIGLVQNLAFSKLDRRLAGALLQSDENLRQTHQWLAAELGSVREVISRTLKSFERKGLVRLSRNRIEILDRAGLEAIANFEKTAEKSPAV